MKLSVAIPTYNGAKYIKEALDSIISQLDENGEDIEIVISDNASTDQTPEIIKEYQKKHSFIKYFRNNENLGADSNIHLAVRRSTGEFAWLFSDDDQLRQGAIKKVLEVLKNHLELAAVFVNWQSYDCNLGQYDSPPAIKTKKDILFKTANEFLSNIRLNATFLSSIIVRRSLWREAQPENYVGTHWLQYAALLTLIRGYWSYCIAEPYVIHMERGGYMRLGDSAERSMKCVIGLMKVLRGLGEKGYSKESVNKVIGVFLHHLPMEIVVLKKNGLILKKYLVKNMISQFKSYPSFWLIDLPLLLLPNIFHRAIFKIYKLKPINKVYRKIVLRFSSYFH